jgi:hypothetical protein
MGTTEPKIKVIPTCWHHRVTRIQIYNEMRELEKQFSWTSKIDQPARWFRLQDELGYIYKQIMQYYNQ